MTSWVLHCGSQFKPAGQSNVDFDLNLNQTLEFPDETKCTVFNLNVPNCVPNVCDSFDNRTWYFKFRLYAYANTISLVGGTAGTEPWHLVYNADMTSAITQAAILHSEYTMQVQIPEGSYQESDQEPNFTESTNISENSVNTHTQAVLPAAAAARGIVGDTTATGMGTIGASKSDASANFPYYYSQMSIANHRYAVTTGSRNRTYAEALQKAIRHKQQQIRTEALLGIDGLGATQLLWTDPTAAYNTASFTVNQNFKQRILRFLVSEMNITVQTNGNHQPEFLFRTNLTSGNNAIQNYLSNRLFFNHSGASQTDIVFGTPHASEPIQTGRQLNPWLQGTTAQNGSPTHFIQCQITAPAAVRFAGRSVSNCLDFYHSQYFQTKQDHRKTLTAAGGGTVYSPNINSQIISSDLHQVTTTAADQSKASTTASGVGIFTPWGMTWTCHPIIANRTDPFSVFTNQDGTDGWFACCYFGVRSIGTAPMSFSSMGTYMYSPVVSSDLATKRLVFVNDVNVNRTTKNTSNFTSLEVVTTAGSTLLAPNCALLTYGTNSVYPTGALAASGELLSDVFTGQSVWVTSASFDMPSRYLFGSYCLSRQFYNIPTMDYESTNTFIIEIEMMGTGNHMKFTGINECKRVKITKRMTLSKETHGGFLKMNNDGQQTIDYGTCLGLSKVSSIKCRVLNERGEVLKFANLDSFPPWTFSLAFE